jgi:hypothetical protein
MQIDGSDRCPVCRKNFRQAQTIRGHDGFRVDCELCGIYEISHQVVAALRREGTDVRQYLTAHLRQAYEIDGRVLRLDGEVKELADLHRHSSVYQKVDKLLRFIARRTKEPGDQVELKPDRDYPLIDAISPQSFIYFLDHLEKRELIERKSPQTPRLTVKGWAYLDPGSAGGGIPGHVFVAM